jgi:hypothetical protein
MLVELVVVKDTLRAINAIRLIAAIITLDKAIFSPAFIILTAA